MKPDSLNFIKINTATSSNLFHYEFQSSSTTLSTTTPISMEIPVIGGLINVTCSLENVEICKNFCCPQNTSQEFPVEEDYRLPYYIVNDVFLETDEFIGSSTAKSTTNSLPLSSSTLSRSSTSKSKSSANVAKKKLESKKHNKVPDVVTKSTLTILGIKGENIDLKSTIKGITLLGYGF